MINTRISIKTKHDQLPPQRQTIRVARLCNILGSYVGVLLIREQQLPNISFVFSELKFIL